MPAQQRSLPKNYIGIVSESLGEQRAAESMTKSGRLVRDYFLDLIAMVLKRQGKTRG